MHMHALNIFKNIDESMKAASLSPSRTQTPFSKQGSSWSPQGMVTQIIKVIRLGKNRRIFWAFLISDLTPSQVCYVIEIKYLTHSCVLKVVQVPDLQNSSVAICFTFVYGSSLTWTLCARSEGFDIDRSENKINSLRLI